MKLLKTLAAAGVLAAFSASPAWADWGDQTTPICGGGNFSTCAAVEVTGAGTNTITITVVNLGGAEAGSSDAIFFAVGVWNTPAGFTGSSFVTSPGADFKVGDEGLSGLVFDPNTSPVTAAVKDGAAANGLEVGESITFTLTFDHLVTAGELEGLGIGIHAGSGPNGCSTKLGIEDQGGTTFGPPGETGDPVCSETVIPEPITMTLLATGLAGMGGAGFLRRKKDEEIG